MAHHQNPFELYARRWNIECLFNKTKTKGFNMESSHITKPDRIVALFTIIA
ncbi:MAG: transposase, partial [Neisseriaceae bacterium]